MLLYQAMNSLRFTRLIMAMKWKNPFRSIHPCAYCRARIVLALPLIYSVIGCSDYGVLMPDPSVHYVAFGDSETSGSSGRDYPEILAELLGQTPDIIANQGRGGETTAEGLDRLRDLLSLGIYPNAQVLLYWEGGADIIDLIREVDGLLLFSPSASNYPYSNRLIEVLDHIQANIETVISEGQAAGMKVYVATYFSLRETIASCDPLFLDIMLPSQARNANGYISLLNERIRQAAVNKEATVVDIASADDVLLADNANYLNCNHLSGKGNGIVAQLFADALGR